MLRTTAIIALAVILIAHILSIYGLAARPLHYDENEYLHASWMMAAGKTIYRDFFEDHPPHLFLLLQSVMPDGDLRAVDVRLWSIRARWLCGLFGTIAAGAVMLYAWRMTRTLAAPVVVAAVLLGSAQIWTRGFTDIRAEAPSLALFWVGIVLLTWSADLTRAQALRAGAGIGLMFMATVWNPKWPLECALMGAYYLHYVWRSRKMLIASVGPALLLAAAALIPLVTVTTVRDYLFFNIQLKAAVVDDFRSNPWIVQFFSEVPVWSSAAPQHRWWWVALALAIGCAALLLRRTDADRRLAWIAVGLGISALLECRFVYPYPYVWAQYLVMIAATGSLAYALAAALVPRRVQPLLVVAVTILAMMPLGIRSTSAFLAKPREWTSYWMTLRMLQRADRVWISPPRHPVATFDSSYYWYNFGESTPSAIRIRSRFPEFLPPIGFDDLPPCTLRDVDYLELGDWIPLLDGVCRCAERGFNDGRLIAVPPLAIFAVDVRQAPAPWAARTRWFWSDLCRRQQAPGRGRAQPEAKQ